MKIPTLQALALAFTAAACAVSIREARHAVPQAAGDSPHAGWLTGTTEERFATIERQLRGLDQAMAEIDYRYGELVVAAHERNWEYAAYQTEKIDLSLRLALERRPARAASARPFLEEALPELAAAIRSRDAEELDGGMTALAEACVQCHRAENVLHFKPAVERIRRRALADAASGDGTR